MSNKVKVKKIKVPVGFKDEGIAEIFNQMLGTGNVNMNIAYPRYKRIKGLCEQLVKLFELFVDSPFMKDGSKFMEINPDLVEPRCEIVKFCEESRKNMLELFAMDFSDYDWNLNLIEDDLKKKFNSEYEKMKKSNLVNTFIIMCDKLVSYRKNFLDLSALNYKFITTMSGIEWSPFPFTTLNIKHIFSLPLVGQNTMTYFLTILNKAYTFSRQLYDELQSPDIDIDQFVEIIIANIDEIQKRPELSRCQKAFSKIKQSVGLLKTRFNTYYRDFIGSKDSTIIMQHFIIDVSTSTSADAQTTRQFQKIIAYYKTIAQEQIKNPKVQMLFDKVNESFQHLERGTENMVKIKEDDSNDEDENNPEDDSDPLLVKPIALTAEDIYETEDTESTESTDEKTEKTDEKIEKTESTDEKKLKKPRY